MNLKFVFRLPNENWQLGGDMIKKEISLLSIGMRLLIWILCIPLVLFILVLLAYFIISIITSYQYFFGHNKFRDIRPFNRELWQDSLKAGKPDVVRCHMYRDLVKNYLHFGMPYKEVIKLLGSSISYAEYYADLEVNAAITYFIGNCTSDMLGPLSSWNPQGIDFLSLYFDHNKKLVAFEGEASLWNWSGLQHDKGISIENLKILYAYKKNGGYYRYKTENDDPGYGGYCRKKGKDCQEPCPVEERCNKEDVEAKWGYKVW